MGATENEFRQLLMNSGLEVLCGPRVHWLTNRGHLNPLVMEQVQAPQRERLREIHSALGGNESLLQKKSPGSDPKPDFVLPRFKIVVEVDEIQHFTSDRLRTFDHYPNGLSIGVPIDEYRELIARWRAKADGYRAQKVASDFPFA